LLTAEIKDLFRPLEKGITLVITVGNTFRSDDGVGPYVARNIAESKGHISVLDARDKPENVLDKAVDLRPLRTILIDAADFGGRPGEVRLIPGDSFPDTTLSTHIFPLRIIAKILSEDTGAEVLFLGIQPGNMSYGEDLSPRVKESAEEIIALLKG
jgi:hydrogenase 3 maturation protease